MDTAADILIALRDSTNRLDRLPDALRPQSINEGYALQAACHARSGPYAGWKIGCTTAVMQAYMKIDQPCAGGIRAADVHHERWTVDASRHRRLGVECELAVRLATPLAGVVTHAQAAAAIDCVMAAIEVVEDRYVDWPSLDVATMIADDFFQRACVLGQPIADWRVRDLGAIEGQMTQTGRETATGHGRDILGHPIEALCWLASQRPLAAGTLVMLGSVVKTQWVAAGDVVEVSFGGVSTARLEVV
jgi:2-keto-4-pentenoate hydratase